MSGSPQWVRVALLKLLLVASPRAAPVIWSSQDLVISPLPSAHPPAHSLSPISTQMVSTLLLQPGTPSGCLASPLRD